MQRGNGGPFGLVGTENLASLSLESSREHFYFTIKYICDCLGSAESKTWDLDFYSSSTTFNHHGFFSSVNEHLHSAPRASLLRR